MLYKLEIENFFSIRDRQVLDLTIAPNVPDPEGRYAPIFTGSELRAPKVVAILGANASGKTTVLRALEFIVGMVRDSAQRNPPRIPCERFNDLESESRPVHVAFEFGGLMNLSPEVQKRAQDGETVEEGVYRYELSIQMNKGVAQRIGSESLRQKPRGYGKWQRVFERDADNRIKDSKSFPLSGYQHLLNTLSPSASVLSSFSLFQHPAAAVFVQVAQSVIFQIEATPNNDQNVIQYLAKNPGILTNLNKELNRIDVGVESMRLADSPQGPLAMFRHAGLHMEMPWLLESHGTRSFIKMFPAIAVTLAQGGLFVIDELDASIHPLVLPEILRWFHDRKTRNPHDAQLWFSCHSASLLDSLDKEEIVLCEKDQQGRTKVYSLMDVKVRRDENHYRKYLSGIYGGVPQIG
ncbi:MAG TPA: ATP-binding protein [Steroidobacteraceae bacterium]|nr:ATP-binding protein [Steroidobacteraceae bacterium]